MNKKLIKSIISLIFSAFMVITVSFAWYISNTSASTTGVSVVAKNSNVTDGYLNRYVAQETSTDGTYTLGDDIDSLTDITEIQYNELGYSKVIYELTATVNGSSFSISLANTDSSRTSAISESEDEDGNTIYVNYLSNVAEFTYLTTSTIDGVTYFTESTFDDGESVKYISYGTSGIETIDILTDIEVEEGSVVTIYLLFDYNSDNITKIYSDNLGTTGGDSNIYFKEDLEFRLV